MKLFCECGKLVVEGSIIKRENSRGKTIRAFDISSKIEGTIFKNKSNNPENWTGMCSNCQKENNSDRKI